MRRLAAAGLRLRHSRSAQLPTPQRVQHLSELLDLLSYRVGTCGTIGDSHIVGQYEEVIDLIEAADCVADELSVRLVGAPPAPSARFAPMDTAARLI